MEVTQLVTALIEMIFMQRSFKESVHLLCKKAHSLVFILAFLFSIDSFGQAPAAPDKLGAVVVSSSSVILNWEDKSNNETGFQIERSLSFGIGYSLLNTTAANVRTFTDTGLTAGTTYYYRVRSVNSSGNSFYTLEVIAPVARADYRRFLLDFGDPVKQTTATGWTNITSVVAGSIIPLKDSNGNTTSLNLEVVTEPSANYFGGNDWISTGYNGQMADYPISAVNDSHLAWSGGGSYKLTGLDNSKVYDLRIFGSRSAPSTDREGLYTVNGQQKILQAANNSSRTVLFDNIAPINGIITINFNVAPGSTFAYINVMDIIESTNPSPPGVISKLVLMPSMASIVSPVGEGNPALLLDEQELAGNPAGAAGGQPTTSWGTNLGPKVMTAQIDLGAEYVIKQVWFFDSNGEATLPDGYKVLAVTPAGEATLVNSPMTGYLQWTSFDVDVTARILKVVNPTGYVGMNELVLYGYAVGTNAVPTANAGADQTVDLPNSLSITGSGTDSDGTIASYLWTQVSGPNTATLTGSNTATVTPTFLVAGTYVFRLTVTDNLSATGSDDVEVIVNNPGQGPAAPDKLGAVVVSSSSVILNWEDKSNNETGFQIERSLSFGIGYSLLNTTAANVKTYTDTGLTAGTTYYYRVRSINNTGSSFYAMEAIAPVARADYRRFLLDFGDPVIQTTATGWNNITSVVAGSIIPLKDSNGNTTSLNLEVVTEPSANYAGGNDWISSGYNGQMADYPISAVNDSHLAWSGGGSYKLTGLDNSKVYDLRIFGSRSAPSTDREGLYTVNGQQKILQAANNSSRTVLFDNIAPINGIITINFNVAPGSAFGYINVMDIIESTNPSPPGVISKLVLMPSMASIVSPVGEGNPALLLDEQELAGNPAGAAGGQPTTSWGTNQGTKVMTAQIDLGAEYVIKQVWFFDSNGEATLPDGYKVLAVTPAGEATLVNSTMEGYLTWASFDVDVTARILKVVNPTGYVGMNELVLYGYAVGVNAAPVANAGTDQVIGLPNNSISITGSGTDSDGTIVSYLWTQISGPSTAALTGTTTNSLTASSLLAGSYVFRLSVTDNLGSEGSDDVMVTVNNPGTVTKLSLTPSMVSAVSPVDEGNPALLVDEQVLAGDPASGNGGQPITSWGTNLAPKIMTAQLDLGAAYTIKQVWLFDTSGEATLPDGYKVIANTAAGDVTLVNSGMYGWMEWQSFNVDVTTQTLTIITPSGYLGMNELVLYGYYGSALPIADAGPDKFVGLASNSTSLTGIGTDSDGTITSYLWTQVSGPNTAVLSESTMASASISSLVVGTYVFRLTVTDNDGATGIDEVTIMVSDDGLVPDVLELEALRGIAEGSDGDRLVAQGWPSVYNWPTSATAADFGGWPGVTVVDQDIRELYISGDYYGYFPDVDLPQLKALFLSQTLLYGINASLPNLEQLWIDYNFFSEGINFAAYPKLKYLSMISYSYDCMGCEPYDPDRTNFDGRNYYPSPDMSALVELETYEGGSNNFLIFPTGLSSLTSIKYIYLANNFLQSLPNEIADFNQLIALDVSQNYLTDLPPTLFDLPSLQSLYLSQNRLNFGDLEQFFSGENEFKNPYLDVQYDNQGNLPPLDIIASAGKYTLINNRSGGIHSHYQWQEYNAGNWDNIPDKTLQNLVFDNMDPSYAGKRYRCEITNDWITDITIYSSEFTIESVSDFPMLAPTSLAATAGSSLSISLSWVDNSNEETGFEIERSTVSGGFENVGLAPANAVSYSDPGLTEGTSYYYRIRAINATGSSDYSEEATAMPQYNIDELITQDSIRVVTLPPQVKVTRQGLLPTATGSPGLYLNQFNQGYDKEVFPECPAGSSYIVGFELRYDFGDKNTTIEWLSKLNITLLQDETVLWSSPFQISSKNQVFVSTAFYDQPISCSQGYHFIIDTKLNVGVVPEGSIVLNQIMYDVTPFQFNTANSATFTCPTSLNNLGFDPSTGESRVAWDYNLTATEFDLEWVFLADHEIATIGDFNNSAQAAFQNKEGVRITTADRYYSHLIYYQKGKVWYRVRAVSYNPANPEHRITGAWFYSDCPYLEIDNPQPDKNWQVQTVFAEDGKYKKVVHYFDGTLRTRQSQTNLSTEGKTITGETLYDFEGRKSVEILAAPSAANYNSTLTFKPGLNTFQSVDPLVASNTSATRVKFNYDNQGAENSILSTADGAGRYYSPANAPASVHEMLIPNGEGYVYSQTEYLNDGTGRIKRQSGVGEEFRMDGNHTTRYYYGSASKAELVRLFGSNVGTASHYKKNLVIDGNGQKSVSYHDQSDRVIASALAGKNPTQLDALTSFNSEGDAIIINLNDNNDIKNGLSTTTHKFLNIEQGDRYEFTYDLTALNPEELDCAQCSLDLSISITDPDGELVDLKPGIVGNQSDDTHYFILNNFGGLGCDPATVTIQFAVDLDEVGDYTITKKLVAHELTFEELKTLVVETPAAQQKIQELISAYNQIDYEKCAVCSSQPEQCTEAENAIIEAFNNVATLDCENILIQIKNDLSTTHPNGFDQADIESHIQYCQYELCIKDTESDVFDKQLARISNWTDAIEKEFTNPISIDPFFINPALSGSSAEINISMNGKIANYYVTQIKGVNFAGSIQSLTDPLNAGFYIDDLGNKTNSNTIGRHFLYLDLMERKSQMTPAAYLDELDQQRWALYKSFYLEAKRRTKIEAYASQSCDAAVLELQRIESIPTTQQGVMNWAEGEVFTDPVSEYQLDVTMASIQLACNPSGPLVDPDATPVLNLSPEHNTDIRNYLRSYFDGHPSNVFRVIIIDDLNTDSNLIAIGSILSGYGCGLSAIAENNPVECVTERTVRYGSPNLVVNTPFENCASYLDPTCGWSPANGSPTIVTQNDSRWATLKALECSPTADALWGKLSTPLVPGKNYKLSLNYRPSANTTGNATVSNAYLQFAPPLVPPIPCTQGITPLTVDNGNSTIASTDFTIPNFGVGQQSTIRILLNLQSRLIQQDMNQTLNGNFRLRIDGPTTIEILSSAFTTGVTDGSGPVFTYSLDVDRYEDLAPGNYSVTLEFTYSGGYSQTLPNGDFYGNATFSVSCPQQPPVSQSYSPSVACNQPNGNSCNPLTPCCTDPGLRDINGNLVPKLWEVTSLTSNQNDPEWINQTVSFTATESSKDFVFSLVNRQDAYGCQINTWGTKGTYENQADNTYTNYFNGLTNSYGSLESLQGRMSRNALAIKLNQPFGSCPDQPALTLINNTFLDQEFTVPGNVDYGLLDVPITLHLQNANPDAGYYIFKILGNLGTYIDSRQLNGQTQDNSYIIDFSYSVALYRGYNYVMSLEYIPTNGLGSPQNWNFGTASLQFSCPPQSPPIIGPDNTVLAYLDANDEFGENYYEVFAYVKTPASNYIASNAHRVVYLDVEDPTITIASRNTVTLQQTNNTWQKLTMNVYSHLPPRLLLRSDIQDAEVLPDGVLLLDDYFVGNYRGITEESLDIKDVTIVEDTPEVVFTYCTEYASPIPHDYLSEFTIKCSENLVNESIVLRELAIDKYLEEEITTYSNTLRANCLDGATENLQYSYNPQEYHYTLYYYDQAGNLVQTVPPEGVVPDPINEPQHKLITRYQYNSLNQLLSQTTPDAGESKFWYNDKSQLKLSQNAQQLIDNKYSYTKYDEQGRITEVGEMAATSEVEELIDDPEFPLEQNLQTAAAGTYVLTDITRTHYDQPFENEVQEGFTQQQLRNRVSWVEVTDQASQTPLVTAATSIYKNEGVLNGVNPQGVLASEVTQSGQTYLRIQNNCSGVCTFAGAEFFSPMPVTAGETYLIKAKGYSQSTAPVGFDIKGNGTQSLASVGIGAELPIGAGAEGWVTQTITVPGGVFMLNINLAWASPALNEVFFINEFEIVKQTIDYTNRAATYYSYDIHGNVKSLLQNVPGLTPKRTDYAYDLVSGKVNYVLYQYDQPDQFIHRYSYDADNRLTVVQTSTDGFLWDKDAEYSYYLHGPLARMELGDHRVQGLDYYYTLQGWLKGVNSPTGGNAQINDPGHDGVAGIPDNFNTLVGKDVFAYNLGYFNGDYKPIGGTTTQAALIETGTTVSPLWTGVGGEALGLYNGNISWMATDLAKIGLENSNRNVGVQAMQYRYDQLHRIVQSRSLNYASGAVSRGSAVYDEDYTYDANGNLLTLKRNDELAALKDDFIYTYYSGTNQLKGVADPADSVTYTGAVTSNTKLYKNITLKGNAYIPTGEDVTLRATENIFIENQFNKAGGNSFRAYITEEGQYQYDAIGNLIVDTSEGTKISWTPYGKVRQVKAKGDSVVIEYRYDASGNRIEKRVASLGDAGWGEVFTRYVRDASGNVMTIYKTPVGGLSAGALAQAGEVEQPIYGSSRVGLYKGGRKEGQQWLGRKNFELSNHLGNVLTVITDNITMSPTEGVSATIVSATDYYPFGLEMQGRTYSDTTYRYGFNGKEKDAAFASTTNYDYGFRIYNPRIAKFLSVDPITRSYPMLTPYQYASNRPIDGIDLDGLEHWTVIAPMEQQARSIIKKSNNEEALKNFDLTISRLNNAQLIVTVVPTAIAMDVYLTKGKVTQNLLSQFAVQTALNSTVNFLTSEGTATEIFSQSLKDAFENTDLADAVWSSTKYTNVAKNVLSSMIDVSPTGEIKIGFLHNKDFDDVLIDLVANSANDKIENFIPNGKYSEVFKKFKEAIIGNTSDRLKDFTNHNSKGNNIQDITNLPKYKDIPADKTRVDKKNNDVKKKIR
jgi:RHS repeat-associated protein